MMKGGVREGFRTLALWTASLCGVTLLVACFLTAHKFFFQDLSIYWRSAYQFLQGENPYDIPPVMTFSEGEFGLVNLGFRLSVWAPPYYLAPLLPFALLPLEGAKIVYTAFLLLGVSGWVVASVRGVGKGGHRYRQIGIALIAFPWFAWYDGLLWGGMGVLVACGFLLLTLGLKHQRWAGSTLLTVSGLLLLSIKPHCTVPALIPLLLFSERPLLKKLLQYAVGVVLILAVPILWNPAVLGYFMANDLATPIQSQQYVLTFNGFLRLFGVSEGSIVVIAFFFVVGVLWRKRGEIRRSFEPLEALWVLSPTMVFFSPYAWGHDFALCSGWFWAWQRRDGSASQLLLITPVILLNLKVFFPPLLQSKNAILVAAMWGIGALYWVVRHARASAALEQKPQNCFTE